MHGGAAYVQEAAPYLANNVMVNNQASFGAGLCFMEATGALIHLTLTGNAATFGGGGIACYRSAPALTNSILWGNRVGTRANQVYVDDPASNPVLAYCDVEGGRAAIVAPQGLEYYTGWRESNLEQDPRFAGAAAGGAGLAWQFQDQSPCIKAGTGRGAPATDILGLPRPQGAGPDLGAWEWQGGQPATCCGDLPAVEHGPALERLHNLALERLHNQAAGEAARAASSRRPRARGALKPGERTSTNGVSYVGVNKVHVNYYYDQDPGPNVPFTMYLVAEMDGKREVLVSKDFQANDNVIFEGPFLHTNVPKTKSCQYLMTSSLGWEYSVGLPIEIDNFIWGELQFDDTINGMGTVKLGWDGVSGRNVTVPEGITWTIENTQLDVSTNNPELRVYGSLQLNKDTCFTGSWVHLTSMLPKGAIVLDQVTFDPLCHVTVRAWSSFNADKCFFYYQVSVYGFEPNFTDCEFDWWLVFWGRNGGGYLNNVFAMGVFFSNSTLAEIPKWDLAAAPSPTLAGNSFVGRYALFYAPSVAPTAPIPIGRNYFGGPGDPIIGTTLPGFLDHRPFCYSQSGLPFKIETPLVAGKHRSLQKTLPRFWSNVIYGQNTIDWNTKTSPSLIKNRETLVSVDVTSTDEAVSGAKVWVYVDGQDVTWTCDQAPPTIYRDLSRYYGSPQQGGRSPSPEKIGLGVSTFNFYLPATDKDAVTLKVVLDTTGVTGYAKEVPRGEQTLFESSVLFRPEPRRVNVKVVPIRFISDVVMEGGTTPDPVVMKSALANLMPGMLPLWRPNLYCGRPRPYPFSGTIMDNPVGEIAQGLTLLPLAAALRADMGLANVLNWVVSQEPIDRLVAVVPAGTFPGNAEGVNYLGSNILFVDERYPVAVLHEWGHSLGLWRGKGEEQYEKYRENGLPLVGCTAFNPDPFGDVSSAKGVGRFYHFARAADIWFRGPPTAYDLMGNKREAWPIYPTLQAFTTYFQGLTKTSTSAAAEKAVTAGPPPLTAAGEAFAAGPPPAGTKRLLLTARTQILPAADGSSSHSQILKPETVRALNITAVAQNALPPDVSPGTSYYIQALSPSGGQQVENFTVPPYDDPTGGNPPEGQWQATFDVPQDTYRVEIYQGVSPAGEKIMEFAPSGGVATEITAPVGGATLGEELQLTWESTVQGTPALPLQHLVLWSTDNGATWMGDGAILDAPNWKGSTDFLPAGDQISFKVLSSDGLNTGIAQVDGLRLPPRPPRHVAISPYLDGDVAQPGTRWFFKGQAVDVEDGLITSGQWNSSRDGSLQVAEGVVLSPGQHDITFTVTNSKGLSGNAKIRVTVEDMTTVDVGLKPQDLVIVEGPGRSQGESPLRLTYGKSNQVILKFRNQGRDTSLTAVLQVKPPGGAWSTLKLKRNKMTLLPFEEGSISAPYTPAVKGTYKFRGILEVNTPSDSNLKNNQRTWEAVAGVTATPVLGPPSGTYTGEQQVFLWCRDRDATIRYTVDGTTPTRDLGFEVANGTVITINQSTLLRAVAYTSDKLVSRLAQAAYTIKNE